MNLPPNSTIEDQISQCLISVYPHGLQAAKIARNIGAKASNVMNALGHSSKFFEQNGIWYIHTNEVPSKQKPIPTSVPASPTLKPKLTPTKNPQPLTPTSAYTSPNSNPVIQPIASHTYTTWPDLKNPATPYKPRSNRAEDMFEYCVLVAASQKLNNSKQNHQVWANLLFKYEKNSNNRQNYMSMVKTGYNIFFTKGNQYAFNISKIVKYYPYWFNVPDPLGLPNVDDPTQALFFDLMRAISNEYWESQEDDHVERYKILSFTELPAHNSKPIYEAELNIPLDTDPNLRDGINVTLRVGAKYYACEVVDFDMESAKLYFTSIQPIHPWGTMYLFVDRSFILNNLRNNLNNLAQVTQNDYPIYKFITQQTRNLDSVEHEAIPSFISQNLDDSQKSAFQAALDNDISFIWGPPGTGKSFTLAAIIRALYCLKDERTIVCCTSNIAVDQLVNKVVDIIEQEKLLVHPGNFYRAGHCVDERIVATDFLFLDDTTTTNLRENIQKMKRDLDRMMDKRINNTLTPEIVQQKTDIRDMRKQLQDHTDCLVQQARVVFSTIANFITSKRINVGHFDNLIIDEASMVSMPYLMALASKITKRIILVGDFQQLRPIALTPGRHLNDNVFTIAGIDIRNTDHPALHQLLNQRRSDSKIVELINHTFYKDKLIPAAINTKSAIMYGEQRLQGRIVTFLDLKDGAIRFTKGGTRQNPHSAQCVLDLLDQYADEPQHDYSIGVISPYVGQISLIKALVLEKKYPAAFQKQLKLGTVHKFQGSECDVIIYDIVDAKAGINTTSPQLGKIYHGKDGEQLLNVAISRARQKLIVIGDVDYMQNASGNKLTSATINTFANLSRYRISIKAIE